MANNFINSCLIGTNIVRQVFVSEAQKNLLSYFIAAQITQTGFKTGQTGFLSLDCEEKFSFL